MATTAIAVVPAQRAALHDPLALWHLLSLDAPTVAVVWTAFLARYFRVSLPWTAPAALALAVWLVYAADRLSDAHSGSGILEERHRFHGRYARGFFLALPLAAVALAVLVVLLPAELRTAWMLLGVPMLAYVAAVHVLRLRVPKEAMVGVFFAAATAMPALVAERSAAVVVAGTLLGVLCWLNCVFIARSEGTATIGTVTGWAAHNFPLVASLLLVTALVVFVVLGDGALAVAVGAVLLILLDAARGGERRANPSVAFGTRTGQTTLLAWKLRVRALADVALLSPLVVWPLLRLLR